MFNWSKYLDLASELAVTDGASPLAEASWRTSVSRAYYAAYCVTVEWMESMFIPKNADEHMGEHERWYTSLELRSDDACDLVDALRALKAERVAADYKSHESITASTATEACEEARGILQDLSFLS